MRNRIARLLTLGFAVALLATGCTTNYYGIVTREGAPLYADDDRDEQVGKLHRLDDVYLGHSMPDDDPVAVKVDGHKGYVNRRDLKIFATHNDRDSVAEGKFRARRDVDLDGRDWPSPMKRAIREDRVEAGMSKEMVELAWGVPSGVDRLSAGGETWRYDDVVYDVYDRTDYVYDPGGWRAYGGVYGYYGYGWHHRHWGFGPGVGLAYEFPTYEPVRSRTWVERTVRRTVTFDQDGRVVGFDSRGR